MTSPRQGAAMIRRTLPQRRAELMANREHDELVTASGRQPGNRHREDTTCFNECPPRSSL